MVVAISGGADSVALFRALTTLQQGGQGRLLCAHFNHRLRGAAAGDDQNFVERLAEHYSTECLIGSDEVAARAQREGDGLEAAARSSRYQFLQHSAETVGARYVATAHTADDQAETILHRIVRGTGVAGLAGIPFARRLGSATTLIRPLLATTRAEVLAYLESLGQPYREDSTNTDVRLTRNRIRHDLLPKLCAEYNSDVASALRRLGELAAQAQQVIDPMVVERIDRHVEFSDHGDIRIDASALSGEVPYLQREVLIAVWKRRAWPMQSMGHDRWTELAGLLVSTSGSTTLTMPGNVRAVRQGDELVLSSAE